MPIFWTYPVAQTLIFSLPGSKRTLAILAIFWSLLLILQLSHMIIELQIMNRSCSLLLLFYSISYQQVLLKYFRIKPYFFESSSNFSSSWYLIFYCEILIRIKDTGWPLWYGTLFKIGYYGKSTIVLQMTKFYSGH